MPDKFFLEDTQRKSLRSIIAREMLVNTLIHREFTSPHIAKFVIERDQMYVENANRAAGEGVIHQIIWSLILKIRLSHLFLEISVIQIS